VIPRNFSYLYLNNTYLGYYDDYIALGLTPTFKKMPPRPINRTTDDTNKTKSTTAYDLLDTLMTNLYDLTEKVTQPFRKYPTL
jgi:hypothetical protein